MTLGLLLVIIIALVLLFWVFPSVIVTLLLFFGRCDKGLYMDKSYLQPWKDEMFRAIEQLESYRPKRFHIQSRDGIRLSARWFDKGSDKTVILVHGFKASAYSNCCMQALSFYEKGFNVLLLDQRAHGASGGKAITFGLLEQYDFIEWLSWLRENTASATVIAYGVSMGSVAIAYAASKLGKGALQAMILDCGFSSPYDQMDNIAKAKHIPWSVMAPIVRLTVLVLFGCDLKDAVTASLEKTNIPAFFLHGTDDEVVSPHHGRRNYESCASAKELSFINGAHHTTAFISGGKELEDKIFHFIDKQCTKEKSA